MTIAAHTRPPGAPASWRPLRIAMIGQKGLPATYGGIEHHVEQIGRRLVERGHHVTVFSRRTYSDSVGTYRGMTVRTAPTLATKHLDALVHSATSTVAAMATGFDVLHYHALGPGVFAVAPKVVSRAPVVLTVHGLDHQRDKWGKGSQRFLSVAHWLSGHVPDRTVVVSRDLQEHYLTRFGRDSAYIANGVETQEHQSPDVLRARFGVEPGQYLLFVGRLVPEKGVDGLIRAYRQVAGTMPLLIAGGSSFTDDYALELQRLAAEDDRVRLLGGVFGADLAALYEHAHAFVQPSVLEGLPLTLLEALSHGLPLVASDIPPHQEVLARAGAGCWMFRTADEADLARALTSASTAGPAERDAAQQFARDALRDYDWDEATVALESLYLDIAPRRHPWSRLAARPRLSDLSPPGLPTLQRELA